MELYDPTPIHRSIKFLSSDCDALFSAPEHFTLHITSLYHIPRPRTFHPYPSALSMQDVCVVFPPPGVAGSTSIPHASGTASGAKFTSIGAQMRAPFESRPRIIDSHTVARQSELQDEMRGREFVPASRLVLLKKATGRLQEDSSHLEHCEWNLSDEESSSQERDEESETVWGDDDVDDDYGADDQHDEDEEGDYMDLFDDQMVPFESQAGHVGDLVSSQLHVLIYGSQSTSAQGQVDPDSQVPIDTISGESVIQDAIACRSPTPREAAAGLPTLLPISPTVSESGRATHLPPQMTRFDASSSQVMRDLDLHLSAHISDRDDTLTPHGSFSIEAHVSNHADSSLKRTAETMLPQPVKRRRTQSLAGNGQTVLSVMPGGNRPDSQEYAAHRGRLPLPRSVRTDSADDSPVLGPVQAIRQSFSPPIDVAPLSATPELQIAIAEIETQTHNSRESATAFYSAPSSKATFRAQARMTARTTNRRPPFRDGSLMLYRHPPPWSTVDTWRPDGWIKPGGRQTVEQKVVVNTKGREGIQALTDMINRKKKISIGDKGPGNPANVSASRNPFRRESKAAEKIAKTLVPISTLVVPIFPKEMRETAVADETFHLSGNFPRDRKRSMSIVKRSTECQSPPTTSLKTKSPFLVDRRDGSPPRGENSAKQPSRRGESTTRRKGPTSAAVKSKTTSTLSGNTFDWKSWSKS